MPPNKPPSRGPVDTDPSGAPAHEPSTTEPSMPAIAAKDTHTEPSMPAARVPPAKPAKAGSSAGLAPVAKDRSVRPPRERERPARRRAARDEEPKKKSNTGVLLVLLLLVGGGVGFGYWYKQTHQPPPVAVNLGEVQHQQDLQGLMQQGKNLVRQGKYAEAKAKFQSIFDEDPGFAQGSVKTYLDACVREAPNQAHLDAAADAISKGEVGRAATELKGVAQASTQADRIESLKLKLDDAISSKLTEGRALAGSPGDKTKMKKLKALADDVLVARPEQRDALELRDLAARMLGGPAHVEVEAPPPGDPAADVIARYASGDATGGYALASDCAGKSESCKALEEKMKQLNELLQKVEGLSPEELERALALDHACSGGRNTAHAKPVATRMSSAFYQKASALKVKGEWGPAMAAARKALSADPDSNAAKSVIAEGMEQARNLFQRCYIQKDPSPEDAIPLCQQVVQMLPEGDELRGKAERVLQSLRQH